MNGGCWITILAFLICITIFVINQLKARTRSNFYERERLFYLIIDVGKTRKKITATSDFICLYAPRVYNMLNLILMFYTYILKVYERIRCFSGRLDYTRVILF